MLKLNVGLSRKVGEANYGSRGASVNLELEAESGLVANQEALRDRLRQLFRLARAAVDEELGGNGNANGSVSANNGQSSNNGSGGGSRRTNGRKATQSQVRAIHAIANQHGLDLTAELRSRFNLDRPDDLSVGEASQLIDAFKAQTSESGGRR